MIKELNLFFYDNNNLVVNHCFVGMASDSFEIILNKSNLSDKEIAKILNNDWYGENNELDYDVTIKNRRKRIRIIENLF